MRIDLSKIVWTAVVSAVAGVGVLVSAFLGSETWLLASGFIGIISATLASRDR
jgi:hypothetical protein